MELYNEKEIISMLEDISEETCVLDIPLKDIRLKSFLPGTTKDHKGTVRYGCLTWDPYNISEVNRNIGRYVNEKRWEYPSENGLKSLLVHNEEGKPVTNIFQKEDSVPELIMRYRHILEWDDRTAGRKQYFLVGSGRFLSTLLSRITGQSGKTSASAKTPGFISDLLLMQTIALRLELEPDLSVRVIARGKGKLKTAYTTFSNRYYPFGQDGIIDAFHALKKTYPSAEMYWARVTEFCTYVNIRVPELKKDIIPGITTCPGIQISTSDTGDSSLTVKPIICTGSRCWTYHFSLETEEQKTARLQRKRANNNRYIVIDHKTEIFPEGKYLDDGTYIEGLSDKMCEGLRRADEICSSLYAGRNHEITIETPYTEETLHKSALEILDLTDVRMPAGFCEALSSGKKAELDRRYYSLMAGYFMVEKILSDSEMKRVTKDIQGYFRIKMMTYINVAVKNGRYLYMKDIISGMNSCIREHWEFSSVEQFRKGIGCAINSMLGL